MFTQNKTLPGLGMTEHIQGTEGIMALVNLALLTGNIGKPGTGVIGMEAKPYVPLERAWTVS